MPVSEKKLIEGIRRQAGSGRAGVARSGVAQSVATGIGDDCAVLRVPRGHEMLVTTDFSIEGVHFRRDWHGPELVGRRCLTRGLSDIAAMGGEPRAVFLSLAVPGDLAQGWVDRFLKGLLALAGGVQGCRWREEIRRSRWAELWRTLLWWDRCRGEKRCCGRVRGRASLFTLQGSWVERRRR